MKASRATQKRLAEWVRAPRAPEYGPRASGPRECGPRECGPRLTFGRKLVSRGGRVAESPAPSLDSVLAGRELRAAGGGRAFLVESSAPAPPALDGEGALFLDIETTGLSSTPLFLIGVMALADGVLAVRQYLARDYSEEAAVISLFGGELRRAGRLVSFNGKSYDLPYIRARAAATGVPFPAEPTLPHLDLLHAARRAWGEDLPNCRLVTLERLILGRERSDDIPGSEIPDAYHEFVRTGNATKIAAIVLHNRIDLVSMASLLVELPR